MIKKTIFTILAIALFSLNSLASDFSAHINTIYKASGTLSIHTVDMDGDGDQDIIEANEKSIIWHETLENGSEETHMIGTAKNPTCVYASDMDGDGDMDILCTISERALGWYENDGKPSPSFSYHTIDLSARQVSYLRTSDMDHDGDLDVVTCQLSGKKVVWYEQKDYGRFSSHTLLSTKSDNGHIVASDMDRDGNLDFVTSSTNPSNDLSEITWYRNNGKGGTPDLRPFTIIQEANHINTYYCVDLDQDDDMDIVAGLSTNEIIWYENNGNGFTRNSIATFADTMVNFYPEDVNLDGTLDFVCKFGQDKLILLENTSYATPHFVKTAMTEDTLFADTLF